MFKHKNLFYGSLESSLCRFPNNTSLADFIIQHRIKGAEVQSYKHILTASLSEEELKIAFRQFGAVL
jgi:hypothetical protein